MAVSAQHDIIIRMMDGFVIEKDGRVYEGLAAKSRRGISLVQYLILQRGRPVPSPRLIREMWSDHRSEYPEAALKTMISRDRQLLREIDPRLAECIVSGKGTYAWESRDGIFVDVLAIMAIFDELEKKPEEARRVQLTEELLTLYRGDLYQTGDLANGTAQSNYLHMAYLEAVFAYIDILMGREAYNRVCEVCRMAMEVDSLDEQLYISLMNAMVHLNRADEALRTYRRIETISRRYYDAPPSEDLQAYYRELSTTSRAVQFNLDVIRNELMEKDTRRGPFECNYETFKEFYNIQMRNIERLGSTMFLAVITVGSPANPVTMESSVAGLLAILRQNLRKGDIITRYKENIVAMLLPTVNYASGSMVMERIEHLFRAEYPEGKVPFLARIAPLGGGSPSA